MRKEVTICDNCKKVSDDFYSEVDWISFDKTCGQDLFFYLQRTGGRYAKQGTIAKNKVYKKINLPVHFCCYLCFADYFKKALSTVSKKEK